MIKEANLEWRMYGLVPYNISPIQQGIQFGHAVQEFNNLVNEFYRGKTTDTLDESNAAIHLMRKFEKWSIEDKTFIILNGGTTNNERVEGGTFKGSLNNHVDHIKFMGVTHATFCEPDLGDQLTAVVFLVEERVFNNKDYPPFVKWLEKIVGGELPKQIDYQTEYPKRYEEWKEFIGGEQNVQLKEFLSQFRLA